MATTTPGQFVRQVRQEMSKVTWPARRDTSITVLLVFIFCMIFGVYFLVVDKILSFGVSWLFA
jgi:preprotein translocase subunit SecE